MFRIVVALSFLVVLYGCASGSSIVTGKARPATKPSEVKLYLDPPSLYSTVGIVEASSEVELSSQAAQDRAINELKKQAAKIGANGVLLLVTGDKSGDMVGFVSGNMFFAGSSEIKVAKGKAIFVVRE